MLSKDDALLIESEFIDKIEDFGDRRYAWIFIDDLVGKYREDEEWYELGFSLPKGCYATVLLREILRAELNDIEL
jgi:tRNA pseudouridine13 synthase